MNHAAPLAAPRESIFVVLASSARRLSYGELSSIAAASGIIALAAASLGIASWMLLAACYVLWCFAGWGILFHASTPRTLTWSPDCSREAEYFRRVIDAGASIHKLRTGHC